MKNKIRTMIAAAAMTLFAGGAAKAQFYEISRQLPDLISPALSGSMSYKGFVEVSGLAGFGDSRVNFLGVSTTQGFQYRSWFFMGVGIGVEAAMARQPDNLEALPPEQRPDYWGHSSTSTKVMIPLYTDFRFNIGNAAKTSFFIDLKLGAAWLMGHSYLCIGDKRMGGETQFYFRPTLGMRFPLNPEKPRQAFNVGVTYGLLTANNNYAWDTNAVTLNGIGLTVSYEW